MNNIYYKDFRTFMKKEYERVRSNFKFLESYKCAECGSIHFNNGICSYCNQEDTELRIKTMGINESLDRVIKKIYELDVETLDDDFDYLAKLFWFIALDKRLFDMNKVNLIMKKLNYRKFIVRDLLERVANKDMLTTQEKRILNIMVSFDDLINPELVEKIRIEEPLNIENFEKEDKEAIEEATEDIKTLEYLLDLDLNCTDNTLLICNYIIKDTALGRKTFSYKTLEQAFIIIATTFMKYESKDKKCVCLIRNKIEDRSKKNRILSGVQYFENGMYYMEVLRKNLEDFYDTGNIYVLETMVHEANHVGQDVEQKTFTIPTVKILKKAIDFILSNNLKEYDEDNYNSLYYEMESRIEEYSKCKFYLESLGIGKLDEDEVDRLIDKELKENDSQLRKVNDKTYDIRGLFDTFIITHPELLDEYPILKYKYKIVKDLTKLKDEDELQRDYEILISANPSYSKQINLFYDHLFYELSESKKEIQKSSRAM